MKEADSDEDGLAKAEEVTEVLGAGVITQGGEGNREGQQSPMGEGSERHSS